MRVDMNEKIDMTFMKALAHQLLFDLSDEEAEALAAEFDVLQKEMSFLDAVDTEDTEEMVYPFEAPTSFLREDEITNVISQADALANVNKKIEGHFVLPKVVK